MLARLFGARANGGDGLTALVPLGDETAIARVDRERGKPALRFLEFIANHDEIRAARRALEHRKLGRSRCTTVLDSDAYQLLLVEAPDVRPDELRAAVRWRIKDLIPFHVDDAVIDVFEIPSQTSREQGRMMYAVAARASAVRERVDLLEGQRIALEVIDIPEMCLRNVAALAAEDARGVALLTLAEKHGWITLTRQGVLYLARRLDFGHRQLAAGDDMLLDQLVLEVQRSLDYYESHFTHGPIGDLLVAPLPTPLPGLVSHLARGLAIRVAPLDLAAALDGATALDAELVWRGLVAIGAALRHEEVAL
jgi:MSHA biogenesis protein MshI